MDKRRVILDCDPGIDDCISLLTAMASPESFDILGITTVAGNVSVAISTQNALRICEMAKRSDVPVFAGCPRPMIEAPVFAEHIHGETGLGDAVLPEPSGAVSDLHAVDFIIETLRAAAPDSITLVPTGPLTNIAVALIKAPEIAAAIRQIVLMGGASSAGGNITASAEFNIYADPHAARVVFACGRPITAMGLDATLQLRCTPERMDMLKGLKSEVGDAAHAMISHVNRIYGEIYGAEGAALHDPCTIGYLLAPDFFGGREAHIRIETESVLTRGHTAVDFHGLKDGAPNALWIETLEAEALFALILDRLGRL